MLRKKTHFTCVLMPTNDNIRQLAYNYRWQWSSDGKTN